MYIERHIPHMQIAPASLQYCSNQLFIIILQTSSSSFLTLSCPHRHVLHFILTTNLHNQCKFQVFMTQKNIPSKYVLLPSSTRAVFIYKGLNLVRTSSMFCLNSGRMLLAYYHVIQKLHDLCIYYLSDLKIQYLNFALLFLL